MKVVYAAVAENVNRRLAMETAGKFVGDCFDPDQLGGIFFTKQLITPDMTEYPNDEREEDVGNLMQFSRHFDEVWLIGRDVPDETFDKEFRMELRVINHDGRKFRRIRIKDPAKTGDTMGSD